jgi:hypothetical protein
LIQLRCCQKLAKSASFNRWKSGAGKCKLQEDYYEIGKQDIPFLILDFQGEYIISNVLSNSKSVVLSY